MKKRKNGPANQPVEKPMDAAEAAQILSKRAGLLRQIGPELLEDNARTRQFIQALEMGARALLRETGVDALEPERADGGDGQRAECAAHHRG